MLIPEKNEFVLLNYSITKDTTAKDIKDNFIGRFRYHISEDAGFFYFYFDDIYISGDLFCVEIVCVDNKIILINLFLTLPDYYSDDPMTVYDFCQQWMYNNLKNPNASSSDTIYFYDETTVVLDYSEKLETYCIVIDLGF